MLFQKSLNHELTMDEECNSNKSNRMVKYSNIATTLPPSAIRNALLLLASRFFSAADAIVFRGSICPQ